LNSILTLKESDVTKFIVEKVGSDILRELRINTKMEIFYEVKGIIENGDLDILMIDPLEPQEAIVFECKRIKVKIEENQNQKVNKQNDLKKLVQQVNDRIKRGFNRVYLTIIIVCDGRDKIANNIFFNNPSSETLKLIYESDHFKKLDKKAGMLSLEPSQLTSKDYNKQAGIGINEIRKPMPQEQPKELTEKIKSFLTSISA